MRDAVARPPWGAGVWLALAALAGAWALSVNLAAVRVSERPAEGAGVVQTSATAPGGRSGDDRDGWVGAAACAACHAEQHGAWQRGRHSKMLQRATRDSVLGAFDRPVLRLRGHEYRLRAAGDTFYVTESQLTGVPVEHRVEFTLGSRRIQHYLTTVDRGRIVVLPPTWDVLRGEWFDSVEIIRPDEGDTRIVQQWNKNCVGCHVSEQDNAYDPATHTYHTTWRDEGTTCERCHGPGRSHVARARAAADDERRSSPAPHLDPAARGVTAPARGTAVAAERSTATCAQCHSLRDLVAPGFRAGDRYDDHFVLKLEYTPRKEQDPIYWADGRPRRFSNDAAGFWQSRCYLRGGATCATCHDPHRPNVDEHAALAPGNAALCTRCHEAIGRDVTAHTRHAANSAGSACIECHMPREVVSIKAAIRDHSIGLPTPENTVAFGIPNACTTCHATKSAAWAVDVLGRWWPNGRRAANVARARAFTAARAGKTEALPALIALARETEAGPLTRANALGYLRGYAQPAATSALVDALASQEPLLRMVAASSLVRPEGRDALERALDDPSRAVRVSALVSLVNVGARPETAHLQARWRDVGDEFAAQAALHEDDALSQTDLGLVHLLNGNHAGAARAFELSLDLAPRTPRAAFLLGLTKLAQGRPEDARAWWRRVTDGDPYFGAARDRLRRLERRGPQP